MTAKPTSAWAGWIRLTRPWNVLAMGLMVVVIQRWFGISLSAMWHLEHVGWVVVPMLSGAAGNLINDYFDVREDRVNKPDRALVGRVVKRRVVLVSHWGMTAVALLWSALLSTHLHSFWPFGMVTVISIILALYSPVLKGRGGWGNLAISLCVGGIVAWSALPVFASGTTTSIHTLQWIQFGLLLAGLNFLREWVKDIQDMDGDQRAGLQTLATIIPEKTSTIVISMGLLVVLGLSSYWAWRFIELDYRWIIWGVAILGGMTSTMRWKVHAMSAWIKVMMGALFVFLL